MQSPTPDLDRMLNEVPYPPEAFHFVRDGLTYTVQLIHEDPTELSVDERHISGQQLCLGLRDFAVDQFGLLAGPVLSNWNIKRTDDFGRIVFAMVDAGLMSKTDDDSIEDFRGIYDFDEAFSRAALLHRISLS